MSLLARIKGFSRWFVSGKEWLQNNTCGLERNLLHRQQPIAQASNPQQRILLPVLILRMRTSVLESNELLRVLMRCAGMRHVDVVSPVCA